MKEETKKAPVASAKKSIWPLLSPNGVSEDVLIRESAMRAEQVADQVADLELDGKVERQPGGFVARRV